MYRNLQLSFSHIKYIILYDSHVYLLFKVHFSFSFILTFFILKCMDRQHRTCRTFSSPLFVFLCEFLFCLAPWNVSKGFWCCCLLELKAVSGGFGNTFAKYWSWFTMLRWCLAMLCCIEGTLLESLTQQSLNCCTSCTSWTLFFRTPSAPPTNSNLLFSIVWL